MTTETSDLYLYGVVPSDYEVPGDLQGVQGKPVRTVGSGRTAAVVGELEPTEALGTPDDLMAHTRVLDAIGRTRPVLPMAFATVLEGDADVEADVLAPREDVYVQALEHLEGHTQYTLAVRFDRDQALREIVTSNDEAARLREAIAGTSEDETRPQRIRLGEIIVRTLESWQPAESDMVLARLREVTADVSVRSTGGADDVVEAAVLVPRGELEPFEAAIEDLAREHHERLRFRLVGPQAPYDFVPEV
ncbi:GvpL/GvpF family gas vesicle protein [Brachybacterium sp. GCM10030252]